MLTSDQTSPVWLETVDFCSNALSFTHWKRTIWLALFWRWQASASLSVSPLVSSIHGCGWTLDSWRAPPRCATSVKPQRTEEAVMTWISKPAFYGWPQTLSDLYEVPLQTRDIVRALTTFSARQAFTEAFLLHLVFRGYIPQTTCLRKLDIEGCIV